MATTPGLPTVEPVDKTK